MKKHYSHKELNLVQVTKGDVIDYIRSECDSDAAVFMAEDRSDLSTDYICSSLLNAYNWNDVPGTVKYYRYLKRRSFADVQARHPEFVAFVMSTIVPWAKEMSRA